MARIDLGKKLNYAREVFMDNCDAPFTAYLKAAKPALLHAALSYYCLDPVDIFTGWARPNSPFKGDRKGGHGRGKGDPKKGGKKWRRFKRVFGFDPNEWLAKKMPYAEPMERRQVPGGAQVMWSAFGQLQRFQNTMFMYQVAEDFFYEVALGVAGSVYCQEQRSSVFMGITARDANFGVAGGTPAVIHEAVKIRNVSWSGGSGVTPFVPDYTAFFSVEKFTPWDNDPVFNDCYLEILRPDGPPVRSAIPDGGGPCSVATGVTGGGSVSFRFVGPKSFWADGCQFHAFGRRKEPTHRPPGWCNDLARKAINWADGS